MENKNYVEDLVQENCSYYEQMKLLELRIIELEREKKLLEKKESRSYNHKSEKVNLQFGISDEKSFELQDVFRFWLYKHQQPSIIVSIIENAPIPLREKLFLSVLVGTSIQSPRNPLYDMFRHIMGK